MLLSTIPVVTASDEHYAPFLGVMIASLLEHVSSFTQVQFHVIDDNISDESKKRLKQTVTDYSSHSTINFLKVDRSLYENFLVSDHITTTAYYRISLPQLLKKYNYQKVLYIDADTLILDNIELLYNSDLQGEIIGAVIDPGQTKALRDRLKIDSDDYYFNSGVMLIDLEKWRKNKITEKTFRFLTEHPERILYHDQDALNAVLYEQWEPLHPRWNMQSSLIFQKHPAPDPVTKRLYQEGLEHPSIIHFTGHDKPWNTLKNHPYQELYMKKLAAGLFMKEVS